jgi:hypothetical protein
MRHENGPVLTIFRGWLDRFQSALQGNFNAFSYRFLSRFARRFLWVKKSVFYLRHFVLTLVNLMPVLRTRRMRRSEKKVKGFELKS